jgi:hypothetical protein
MPKKRTGYTQFPLEFPDDLLDTVKTEAERKGEKVAPWVFRACALRAGVPFEPAKLGAPKKTIQEKKSAKRKAKSSR